MNRRSMLTLSLTAALLSFSSCKREQPSAEPPAAAPEAQPAAQPVAPAAATNTEISKDRLALFSPLPALMEGKTPLTEEQVALGRMLYYEHRISKNQDLSCNSCHNLETFGVDNQKTSPGHKKQLGDRNSPTTYNAAGHFVQFWDGRAADVEAQALGPILNPVEMAMAADKDVIDTLKSMPGYVEAFKKAFPEDKDPMTYQNLGRAIGAFERKLVTPSRWDKFLAGDTAALTDAEKAGFNTFMDTGCQTCHFGAYVGGAMFNKLGLVQPWPDDKDPGRMKVTNVESDKLIFKVPGLRNIDKTGPYFHDGSVATLEEAVSLMAKHQLGKTLTDEQVASIVTWLKSLNGEIPKDYITKPTLPESTPKTRKPDPT